MMRNRFAVYLSVVRTQSSKTTETYAHVAMWPSDGSLTYLLSGFNLTYEHHLSGYTLT